MSRCIGFGEREGGCKNEAGTPWTHLWCSQCDEERRAYLTGQFEALSEMFRVAEPTGEPE
jgi:hypothetical protein